MKKLFAVLTILTIVFGLAACMGTGSTQTTPPQTEPSTEAATVPSEQATVPTTEPVDPAVVGGIDLTGMTAGEAARALNEISANYRLALTINGQKLTLTAEELGLKLDESALGAYVEALKSGSELPEAIFTYDRDALKVLLGDRLNTVPVNASVTYNSAGNQFVVNDGTDGITIDADAAADAAAAALGLLKPGAEAEVKTTTAAPEYAATSDKVKAALDAANGYLKVSLTYTYSPEGGETAKEAVPAATLAGFVSIAEDFSVSISKTEIETYAGQMYDRHSGSDYKGKFVTTGGGTLSTTVTYYGQKVNKTALADDIYKCVTEGISGTRTAPYSTKSSKPYGGSYVEIDLSSQHLWLYKNGERIVSTDLVSGSVAEDCCTPTGVYSIYAKQTDRYLTGEDYRSFVHYWMPFLGGYGLHDASWRGSFGGTIYYYDGSHGCVNLPSSAAKKIYNNVSVGTKVILYGGKREVDDLEQKLTGTTSYTVKADAAPFKLGIKAKYKGAELTYTSSDTSVVKVSSNGTVTVVGVGTATVTVKAAPFDFYTGAELKVTITVEAADTTTPTEPSQPTEPKPTEPQPTEPKPTEPQPTEPKPTEPQPTEPKPTEPQPTEPKPTEPQPTEPKPTEPQPTEPKPTEPQPTEPKPTEPQPTEPAPTEPAPTETTEP